MPFRKRARHHSGRRSGGKPRDSAVFPQFARIGASIAEHRGAAAVLAGGENTPVDVEESTVNLARAAWLVTVLACLVAVLILILDGYYGYAGVTLAVAISAAINLL
jgi:hypothetical protein